MEATYCAAANPEDHIKHHQDYGSMVLPQKIKDERFSKEELSAGDDEREYEGPQQVHAELSWGGELCE